MNNKTFCSRRDFVCSATAALLSPGAVSEPLAEFAQVRLVDANGQGVRVDDLAIEREYIFFYPFVSTPCFLLRLKQTALPQTLQTAQQQDYQWQGGVGKDRSVVAFAAICAHKLTHPAAAVSFIGYRSHPVGFVDQNDQVKQRAAVIQCCSEHSIYDPARGAKVLSGPAPQPLASIALTEQAGELYASGVYGGLLYERFFARFGFRLELEFGAQAYQQVRGDIQIMPTEAYSHQRIEC